MKLEAPSAEQCSEKQLVYEDLYKVGYACWYPQMGGYVAKAVALFDKSWKETETSVTGGCIDVFVWHDGEFPFSDSSPTELHHCSGKQFIEFGKFLETINEQNKEDTPNAQS